MEKSFSESYKAAGVDITAGYRAVELMKQHVARTTIPGCIGGLGGFGGLFELDCTGYKHPVLISGTDGVGTKLKIAFLMDKHDTVGIDCVAMCVNDVVCAGAKPLVFTDRTCEWFNSDDPEYPHKGVVNLPGVTDKDYAQVMFSRADMVSGRFAPDCETAYGQLYIWSKTSAAVNIPLIVVTKG